MDIAILAPHLHQRNRCMGVYKLGTIRFVSHENLTTIDGVSAWSFEDAKLPVLMSFADVSGLIDTSSFSGGLGVRFMAHGHTPIDEVREITGDSVFQLTKNHPGSYSGFLVGSDSALWHNKESDRYFEFTAYGNFRTAIGYRSLLEVAPIQYRMPQRMSWFPPGPTVRPPGGVLGKLPPLPELKWCYLYLRDDTFPTIKPWTILTNPENRRFRFPSPGLMLVNSSGDSSTNDGEEYKLLN